MEKPSSETRQDEADRLKAEAEALKDKGARLEDLHIWQMKKGKRITKKGDGTKTTYTYWMVSWREGNGVRSVHLGSIRKIDEATARLKAQKMKADALGLPLQP